MSKIILVDKPKGITSYDVIRKLKLKYPDQKIGHAGTLDPLASGLLIVLVGKATKLSDYLAKDIKEYHGVITFGNNYDSYDIEGNVIDYKKPMFTEAKLIEAFNEFSNNTYDQIPPKYSALKVGGKKAYKLARQGKDVLLKPREVTIYEFKPTSKYENYEVSFYAKVSKKTYIRSLAYDLGLKLDTYGALKELRRTRIGKYDLKDAGTIDKPKELSVKSFFEGIKSFKFNDFVTRLVKNGTFLDSRQTTIEEPFIVLNKDDKIIAYYIPNGDGTYRPKILF